MNYEQRYKDALDRAKKLKENSDNTAVIDGCEQIFPELQGNEDEQMRQWIIDDIRYNMNNETLFHSEYKKKAEKAIAWLEKQGEQKPSWAEEDDVFLKVMIRDLEDLKSWEIMNEDAITGRINWLKSLKDRCSRKPTEKQIKKTMEE